MAGRDSIAAAEYQARAGRVAEGVRARNLDAVLVWSRGGATLDQCAPVLWLTNFYNPWGAVPDSQCWSGQSYCAALVTRDGECVLVTNIPASEWQGSPVVCDAFTDEPFYEHGVRAVLAERGLDRGRIGLAGRAFVSLELADRVRGAIPAAVFVPADEILIEAMASTSPADRQVIRAAGRAADATMSAMLDASVPGATEREVSAAGFAAAIAHDALPVLVALATGRGEARYAPSTLPTWSDRTLEAGDLWHLDIGGSLSGYQFDFARTTTVGQPPAEQEREMIEAAIATVEAVISAIEPGRPIGDAVARGHALQRQASPWAPAPTKHDYPHLGHTLGVGFGHVWLYENERRPWQEGMYVAVEAVCAREGLGFAMFEQNLLVGDREVELVTRCNKRPWERR